MPASYPSSAKTFTTKSDGAGNTILAAHINDLQLEVTAIEQDLIAGLPVARGGTGATSLTADRVPHVNAGGTALTSTSGLTFDGTTLTAPATTITQPLTISGASAGQIVFPATQNPSANANTLDDYEEGEWTPVIGGSGGTSGQAYTTQIGRYVKIGKLVICWFNVLLSTEGTITTNAQIQGLPFTSLNLGSFFGRVTVEWYSLATSWVYITGEVHPNGTAATLFGATGAAAGLSALTAADLDNDSQLIGVVTYMADA